MQDTPGEILLTVSEYAKQNNVSMQSVYQKIRAGSLKDYVIVKGGKKYISNVKQSATAGQDQRQPDKTSKTDPGSDPGKIAELQAIIDGKQSTIEALEKQICMLNRQMEIKDQQIAGLIQSQQLQTAYLTDQHKGLFKRIFSRNR